MIPLPTADDLARDLLDDLLWMAQGHEFIPKLRAIAESACRRAVHAEVEAACLEIACQQTEDEVQQILGKALGYPRFCDDQKNFPGATEANGVCVGEHVAVTLAEEVVAALAATTAELKTIKAEQLRDTIPATCGACGHTIALSDGTCGCSDNRRHPVATIRRSILDERQAALAAAQQREAGLRASVDEALEWLAQEPESMIVMHASAILNGVRAALAASEPPADDDDFGFAGHYTPPAVLAADAADAAASELPQTAPDMRRVYEVLGFDPTNHHNAAKCPYCRSEPPQGTPAPADIVTGVREECAKLLEKMLDAARDPLDDKFWSLGWDVPLLRAAAAIRKLNRPA